MSKNILAICDREQEYAFHLMDYLSLLRAKEGFPFEIQAFTNEEKLRVFCSESPPDILLISQADYEAAMSEWVTGCIMLLMEDSGLEEELVDVPGEHLVYRLPKYSSVDRIVHKIMDFAAKAELLPPARLTAQGMKLIGIYTPVGRCLQTTFSFTLGQLLARKHRVLYLNFESYSGLGRMLGRTFESDLSDLVFYLHNRDERFPYRLGSMTQKLNGLDYIPPAFSCMDLAQIETKEWLSLFQQLDVTGMYEYVILDLSDMVVGLFDILERCSKVYTIVREDSFALAKVEQYELLLGQLDRGSILERTRKCCFPVFRQLPVGLWQLTRGELADFTERIIQEDFGLEDERRG